MHHSLSAWNQAALCIAEAALSCYPGRGCPGRSETHHQDAPEGWSEGWSLQDWLGYYHNNPILQSYAAPLRRDGRLAGVPSEVCHHVPTQPVTSPHRRSRPCTCQPYHCRLPNNGSQ